MNKTEQKFQKSKTKGREALKIEYQNQIRILSKRVKEVSKGSFKNFISEVSKDSWGFAYKFGCGKLRVQDTINTIRTASGETLTWKDTAGGLLDHLIYYKDAEDSKMEAVSQRNAQIYERIENPLVQESPFTMHEVNKAITNIEK